MWAVRRIAPQQGFYRPQAIMGARNRQRPSKRVFDLVKDFGTSESPKSTRSSTTHWCPGRPGHPAFRHNIASSLRLHTGLPYDWTPRSDAPLGSPLAPSARRVSRVASRLPGTTRLRFALHGGQRWIRGRDAIKILNGLYPRSPRTPQSSSMIRGAAKASWKLDWSLDWSTATTAQARCTDTPHGEGDPARLRLAGRSARQRTLACPAGGATPLTACPSRLR